MTERVDKLNDTPLAQRLYKALVENRGVWRDDLLDVLGELGTYWEIDERERNVQLVRDVVIANLRELAPQAKPRRSSTKKSFQRVVEVSFNICGEIDLKDKHLDERREELTKPYELQVSYSTTQNYINHVINQIESILTDPNYKPISFPESQVVVTPPLPDSSVEPATIHQEREEDARPGSPGQPLSLLHRRKPQLVVAVLAVFLLAIASSIFIFRPWESPPNPLIATVTSIDSTADYYSSIFPRGSDKGKVFLEAIDRSTQLDTDNLLFDEMEAGGYSHGGVRVHLTVEGNTDREVTINNIRPVNLKREPAVTGEVIVGPTQGTGPSPERMGFILDRVNPNARTVGEDGSYGPAFFDTYYIGLPNRKKQTLILEFLAQASAFSFNIEVDYDVNGKKFHQLLQKDNRPLQLRTSASLCPSRQPNKVPEEDRRFLNGAQYSGVTFLRTDQTGITLERVDPKAYLSQCLR